MKKADYWYADATPPSPALCGGQWHHEDESVSNAQREAERLCPQMRVLRGLRFEKGNRKMKVMLDEGAKLPTRAHEIDAGLDIYSTRKQIVCAREYSVFDTGVHVEIPVGYVGILKSKSGLNVMHDIISDGVIDAGYTGSIKVKLYNLGGTDYTVNAGDKITQLVILPIITPEVELVEKFDESERGSNGFGSSGR